MSNIFHTTVGLWLVFLISHMFDITPEWHHFVLGALFGNLLDLDGLLEWLEHGRVAAHKDKPHDHRGTLHKPLLVLLIGFFVTLPFGLYWSTLMTTNLFLHLVVDSLGVGWGIKWLWPISKRNFKFFANKDNSMSKRLLVSWKPDELRSAIIQYGDKDWLRKYVTSPIFLLEGVVFVLTLIPVWSAISNTSP